MKESKDDFSKERETSVEVKTESTPQRNIFKDPVSESAVLEVI